MGKLEMQEIKLVDRLVMLATKPVPLETRLAILEIKQVLRLSKSTTKAIMSIAKQTTKVETLTIK